MRFRKSWTAALLFVVAGFSSAHGNTVIVNENFQSYNSNAEMQQKWVPSTFDAAQNYALADNNVYWINPDPPPAGPFNPGDKGAWHVGGAVALWNGYGNELNNLQPTSTHKVVLQYDMWDENESANKRVSVGMRQVPAENPTGVFPNLFEMGVWNNSIGFYAMRMLNFPGIVRPTPNEGGWFGYTNLQDDEGNAIPPSAFQQTPSIKGWHTLRAEFEETKATFTIDLGRTGIINGSVVVPYTSFHSNNGGGFHQLRFGGPSGVGSAGGGLIFDNIYLALEELSLPGQPGDHNGDGFVDASDYVVWRANPAGHGGDDGYTAWRSHYGQGTPPGSGLGEAAFAAVPEPATASLLVICLMALAGVSRRRGR